MPHSVRVILKKALHKGAITPADYEKVMRNVIQVRCKDCKHRDKYECNNITLGGTKCGVTDEWFCADGERKETEDANKTD